MSFRIGRQEKIEAGIKRILSEQMDKAEAEIKARGEDIHEAVHQVRKRCKKIRSLYRLVRPGIPHTYKQENARFRDAARTVAEIRDAQALTETYDALTERFEVTERQRFSNIRRILALRRNALAEEEQDLDDRLHSILGELRDARRVLQCWSLGDADFKALRKGYIKTYKRGQNALEDILRKPTDRNLHEWRKRVKYHRYHLKTLRGFWPALFRSLEDEADHLGSLLGDDHDLAVMLQKLGEESGVFASNADLTTFVALARARRQELQVEARLTGKRLFALAAKENAATLKSYWKAWHTSSDANPDEMLAARVTS